MAAFAHKAVGQLDAAIEVRTTADDGVLTDDTRADDDGVLHRAADCAVVQSRHATQLAAIIEDRVDDDTRVDHAHVVTDGAATGAGFLDRLRHHALDGIHHGLVVAMLDHKRRQLAVEVSQQQQVAVAHLVEHGDGVALAVVGIANGVDGAHIRDIAPVTDGHIIQIVTDILDEAVVSDGHIAQRGVVDAAVLHKAVSDFHCSAAVTQSRPSVELHTMAAARVIIGRYLDVFPVLCPTVILFQGFDLLVCQLEVFFHVLDIKNEYVAAKVLLLRYTK